VSTFAGLCRDLFLLSQFGIDGEGPTRGFRWESRIADYLARRGAPVEALPGGCRIFGHSSLSGLAHQIDGAISCGDALVIGEWKAHRGRIPKNELLRFKAGTDDFFMAMPGQGPRKPVMRVFGGAGAGSRELRSYAALHGISLIEPTRWPAPVLATAHQFWPSRSTNPPSAHDRRRLAWLARPVQHVLAAQPSGGYLVPRPPPPSMIRAVLDLHEEWSDRLWEAFDENAGSLESLIDTIPLHLEIAS
jgi:hypothetical protein